MIKKDFLLLKDAIKKHGKFINEDPSPEDIKRIHKLLQVISNSNDGTLGLLDGPPLPKSQSFFSQIYLQVS